MAIKAGNGQAFRQRIARQPGAHLAETDNADAVGSFERSRVADTGDFPFSEIARMRLALTTK